MKVSVELDLTCPREMAFFTQLVELRDAQSVPVPVTETLTPPEPKDWTEAELRKLIAEASVADSKVAFQRVGQLCKDFQVESISDLTQDQRSIIADELSRFVDSKKAFSDG